MQILFTLGQAAAVLIALTYVQGMILRRWAGRPRVKAVVSGAAYGVMAVVAMMAPVQVGDGVIFDPRSVVLAMSGLFGGPLPAALAAVIAGAYRWSLGPPGDVVGMLVIVSSAGLGLLYRLAVARGRLTINAPTLLAFGALVHGVAAGLFLLLPPEVAGTVWNTVTPVFVPTLSVATLLLGLLMRDVSDRVAMERAAHDNARRADMLFTSTPTPTWIEDQTAFRAALRRLRREGVTDIRDWLAANPSHGEHLFATLTIKRANAAAARLFKAPDAEAMTGPLTALGSPEALASFNDYVAAVWDGQPSFQVQTRLSAFDGSAVDVVLSVPPVEAPSGYADVPVTVFDIGERLRAEQRLAEREALYHSVIVTAHDGFWLMDSNARLLEVNDAYLRMTGFSREELLGRRPDFVDIDTDETEIRDRISALIEGGSDLFETRHRTKAGAVLNVEIGISYSEHSGGRMFVFIRDVTRRKQAQAEILAAKTEAERANRAKSEFLAAMSHDLRTPLNAIMGFADMLRLEVFGPLGTERYRDYARNIHDSGALLVSLVNDVLDLSKIEAGKYELRRDLIDLPDIMARAAELNRIHAEALGQVIEVHVAPDMPTLLADERALMQIFNNLLSNAVKFNRARARVRFEATIDSAGCPVIRVEDQGIGMTPDDLRKALRPFEQVESTLARPHVGTGLGLHLCSRLMDLFDGRMKIDSEPGEGTVVALFFPASRAVSARPETRTG